MKMCLVMILVMKVFIFSKTMIICLLCPLLCGLFFFWKGAKGELSYKVRKRDSGQKSLFVRQFKPKGYVLLIRFLINCNAIFIRKLVHIVFKIDTKCSSCILCHFRKFFRCDSVIRHFQFCHITIFL